MTESPQGGKIADPKEMYPRLRDMMLQGSRSKFGLPPTLTPTEPWGVLMDWGVDNGTGTVVAMSDGSASVYFSSGGGYMGGKGIESVRLAALSAIEVARQLQLPSRPTTTFPLPEVHGVSFYFLTETGVYMVRTSEKELDNPNHPLRGIGGAMQNVMTQFRLWRKKTDSGQGENPPRRPN